MSKILKISLGLAGIGFIFAFAFSNCAPQNTAWIVSESRELASEIYLKHIDMNHGIETKVQQTQFYPNLTDRKLTSIILEKIFGPNSKNTLRANLLVNPNAFGGGCSIYEEWASEVIKNPNGSRTTQIAIPGNECSQVTSAQIKLKSTVNVSRQGWMIKACEALTTQITTLNSALQKIDSQVEIPSINEQNVFKMVKLFYFDDPDPNQSLLESILILMRMIKDPRNAWAVGLYTVCTSSQWQVQ